MLVWIKCPTATEQVGRFVFLVQAMVILCPKTQFVSAVAFQLCATCACQVSER